MLKETHNILTELNKTSDKLNESKDTLAQTLAIMRDIEKRESKLLYKIFTNTGIFVGSLLFAIGIIIVMVAGTLALMSTLGAFT